MLDDSAAWDAYCQQYAAKSATAQDFYNNAKNDVQNWQNARFILYVYPAGGAEHGFIKDWSDDDVVLWSWTGNLNSGLSVTADLYIQ